MEESLAENYISQVVKDLGVHGLVTCGEDGMIIMWKVAYITELLYLCYVTV